MLHSLLIAAASVAASASEAPIPDFRLAAAAGDAVSLHAAPEGTRATVVTMTTLECPVARLLLPRLAELERSYADRGVRFVGIDPNAHDEADAIEERRAAVGVRFPILRDPTHVVCDRLGVARTTEVLLLDHEFRVVYRGAVDDQYTEGARRPAPTVRWLCDALDATLKGEPVAVARTDAPGCRLGAAEHDGRAAAVTFHRDVAPILNANCVECHRPGQIGPMSLLDPETARSFADMIAEVTGEGRMPPWYADPRHGRFSNERRLTDTDKTRLAAWAASGASLGDPADAPAAPLFDDAGWAIGTPDLVIELPDPVSIPATGVMDYRYVVIDPELTEDRWVEAIEIRPSAPDVTHHVLALEVWPGVSVQDALAARDSQGFVDSGYYAVYVPGARPNVFPPGAAKELEAGTRFVMQLHYTPNGIATTDRTRMAFRFSHRDDPDEVFTSGIANGALRIPANTRDVSYQQVRRFDWPVKLLSVFPHMHSRGQAFRYEHLDEEGNVLRVLLDVPEYDFNWQELYRFEVPVLIDEDESIRVTAVYDNSAQNPNNPNPDQVVRWGDQTFEEMMIGYIDFVDAD